MENADVAASDKARSSEHYSEMDREHATQNDISQRGSSPSGKAMDRQREAQEYIRNRRAQATVADEADENVMVDNVSQFGPQNISRESEDDEQKLLITLAEKYNYNLYLPPGNSGSPIIEHTNYAALLHRNAPSSPQTRQITDGHDSWHHSRPRNRSGSPQAEDPPRTPSPSIRHLDNTQITPSPPPPIPTAPISDFRPGPIFSTSHMPYQAANNPRPAYATNLRQYADRNRTPGKKQTSERSGFENNTANSETQPSVNSQLSDRYRHNQIASSPHQKSQSPQAAPPTQWAAPKPARNNANIVQNLQDSQALQLAESGSQPSRLHPVSYPSQSRQEASQQNIEHGHDSSHPNGPELWSHTNRLPQKNYPTPDSVSGNSRRQMSYAQQNNARDSPKAFGHAPAGQITPLPQGHHGNHGHETYGPHHEHDMTPSNYGYDQSSQGEFSPPTTIPNQSNFTPESHGNSTRGHGDGYSSEHQFEQSMHGRRPQIHGSISSTTLHRQSNFVDWKSQLCQLFNAPHDSHDEDLFKMLEMTRSKLLSDSRDANQEKLALPYHTIYRVRCHQKELSHMFLDTPWLVKDSPTGEHIHGSIIVRNIALHTQEYTNLSFIVYKDYACCRPKIDKMNTSDSTKSKSACSEQPSSNGENELAEFLVGESVCLIGSELSAGLKRLTRQNIQENSYYPSFNVSTEFKAPYPWFYHQRAPLEERRRQLKPELLARVNSFVEYVNESFGPEYAIVDTLLSQGKISRRYLCYLYSPDAVILRADKDDEGKKKAYLTKSWLYLPAGGSPKGSGESATLTTSLLVSSWTFDGLFQENVELITIDDFKTSEEVVKITALTTYPMRYADPTIGTSLRKQGEMFWKFRKSCYIYYSDEDESEENIGQSRYMIDIETYKKLHPKSAGAKLPNRDDLGPLVMASDIPPEGVFTLLLPSTIIGFNMQEKKWVNLEVSRMYAVKWNKDAFETLARDNDTKILITSLVANQIKDEQSPGLIGRKGNGSIILLRGSSGTGKTLTAESVSEVVEKPLYVTSCSEIGTTPEALEKALERIFFLGRVWKCVILLEDAEMFLEKRTLGDLQRNALISVFLRALESYNGIVILTSSPITTMDEAFKSRIQLFLRYTSLTFAQRAKIWESHIKQLESLESLFTPSTINISELRANLSMLAKYKLNGHEIGHAVRTARQLALWKGIPMGFEEVQYAVSVAGGYDNTNDEDKRNVGEAVKRVVGDTDDDPYDGVEDLMSVAEL
ncbi:a56ed3e4-431d-41f8-b4f6-7bb6a024c650 [Sclerotinia trifoliorum]|uniref:A56ed3e4-431d-41f8-b4f6-7bb6a024c650 n=1 Tax=Sclerotinia trifoliorum TaxID=28548 RepID=A0A8H2ZT31_9HELO|nr:a56ed3e4-431d-41f8-b4f6-7bb6a024c650 [Sclerotinia trifoliorum]